MSLLSRKRTLAIGVALILAVNAIALGGVARFKDDAVRGWQQNTRLFAIDASVDADALRAKYQDRAHHAIVRGTIRPQWSRVRFGSTLSASIEGLSVEEINVPRELQPVFQNAAGEVVYSSDDAKRARFEAVVAFGRWQEPWMIRATAGTGMKTAPRQP